MCPSNSREKKASLYVPETNQCHYKSRSPVKEKRYPELSLSVHCQRFSPRMVFNTGFPDFPVHHTATLCDAGTSPASLLWVACGQPRVPPPAWRLDSHIWALPRPAELPVLGASGCRERHQFPSYRDASLNVIRGFLALISTRLSQ